MDALARLSAATTALAEARTLDDVKHILDIAEAARTYARAAKLGLEAANYAAEIKLRAERKAGELLAQLERGQTPGTGRGHIGEKSTSQDAKSFSDYRSVLDDNAVTYQTAHRWQTVASIPEEVFEQHLAETKADGDELSTAGLLQLAKDIKREFAKQERQVMTAAAIAALPSYDDRFRLIHSDIADLDIEDCNIDAILTDPPYPAEYLPVYADLADLANRVLKPGGSLFAMCGQSYLPEIMAILAERMTYNWTLAYLTPGGQAPQIWQRKVNTFWKPVLWFTKGTYGGKWLGDVCKSDVNDNDKRFHFWGQSVSGMVDLVDRCTNAGDLILDPFCGGGATGVAALLNNRMFTGSDIDADMIETTRTRLIEVCNASL